MTRKIFSLALVLAICAIALTVCAQSSSAAEWPKLYYQLANTNPAVPTNQMHKAASLFCKKVLEKTGGAIVIEEINDAQLGGERDYLEGVKLGTIDLCIISNSSLTNYSNENIFPELPFIFKDPETAYKFLDSDLYRKALAEKLTPKMELVVLGYYSGGFRNMINTKRPITKPEDLVGLKIRGQENRIVVAMYQALGANCTPMPVAEVVTAIQQGTVDGADFPLGTMMSYGYPQFVQNLAMTEHLFYSFTLCIAQGTWNKLSPEVQQVFTEAAREAELEERAWVVEMEQKQLEELKKFPMKATQVDKAAFAAKMEPVYATFRPLVGEKFFDEAMKLIGK